MPPVKKIPWDRRPHFLKEWRDHFHLSQDDAAEVAHMSRENYGRIENGRIPYNQDMLERLADRYGVVASDLLSVNPEVPDKPREVYEMLRRAKASDVEKAVSIVSTLVGKDQ